MSSLSPENIETICGLLAKAEEGSIVQAITGLHEYLLSEKLAFKLRLQCDMIGVHFNNRDGIGCSATHVGELISSIAAIGFVEKEVKAICIEVPSDRRGDQVRQFNDRLVTEAAGKLAPVSGQALRYASIVGSHTNQAFRAFKAGLEHSDSKVSVDGRLSMAKLATVDPEWHKCIEQGVEWLVISHSVTEHFPNYAGLAQAAGNTAGQVAAVEHELQLARKVNLAIQAHLAKNPGATTVAYQDVAGEILRSRPPCGSALPGIFIFVLKYGGGVKDDSYMSMTERHVRAHGAPNRSLGNDFWTGLATEVKGKEQHVSWRHWLLKLAFSGAEKFVSVSDLKRAFGRDLLGKVASAERSLADFLVLLKSLPMSPEVVATTITEIEMSMAAIILGKRKYCKHGTIDELLHEQALSFGLPSKWAPSVPSAASTPAASSKEVAGSSAAYMSRVFDVFVKELTDVLALRLYDGAGKLVNNARVIDMGFAVGMEVVRKADDAQGKILSISPDTVELQMSSGVCTVSAESFVENKWKKHTPKQEPQTLPDWWLSSPHASADFLATVVKAQVTIALQVQYDEFVKQEKSLEIFVKPSRDVQVKKPFAAQALRMPVASTRLDVRAASSKAPGGAVQLGSIKASGVDDLLDECNCEIWGPKGWEKQQLKANSSKIMLPFIRNFIRVEKGDSLILHRPELAKTETVEALVPVKKKQRTN
ncbi:unnamed protein product [Symbiodinium microadriaticum]|nr:unnamed protein product [Symbiodinium microadriaticum]